MPKTLRRRVRVGKAKKSNGRMKKFPEQELWVGQKEDKHRPPREEKQN